jgi:hypothetical protein
MILAASCRARQTETNDSRYGIGIAKKDVLDDWQ